MTIQIHQTIEWVGKSGTVYRYYIWPRGAYVDGGPPGNFIHVRETKDGVLEPLFIGQTDDLNVRILHKEYQQCVDAHGATQLHLHSNYKGEQARTEEKADLIARWQPICNAVPLE